MNDIVILGDVSKDKLFEVIHTTEFWTKDLQSHGIFLELKWLDLTFSTKILNCCCYIIISADIVDWTSQYVHRFQKKKIDDISGSTHYCSYRNVKIQKLVSIHWYQSPCCWTKNCEPMQMGKIEILFGPFNLVYLVLVIWANWISNHL